MAPNPDDSGLNAFLDPNQQPVKRMVGKSGEPLALILLRLKKNGKTVIPPEIHQRMVAFSENKNPLSLVAAPKGVFRYRTPEEAEADMERWKMESALLIRAKRLLDDPQ